MNPMVTIPITLSPEEHDFSTAAISHLPHLISASLVNLVNAEDNEDEILKTIAAGGFRDITRISSSSPIMWQNICLSNRDEILKLMNLYKAQFAKFEKAVSDSDPDELMTLFSNAKDYRDSLPVRSKGALAPSYEFYLDVEDEPGAIAMISLILALNQISIKNIGVLHNREFEEKPEGYVERPERESRPKGHNGFQGKGNRDSHGPRGNSNGPRGPKKDR